MPKVDEKAVLEVADVKRAIEIARGMGPFEFALIVWLYEQGARASEPGLQLIRDVDLRAGRLRVVRLKRDGKGAGAPARDLIPIMRLSAEALPLWLEDLALPREGLSPKVRAAQKTLLFPSADPKPCYVCRGTGRWKHTKNKGALVDPCRQCDATGTRYGLSRYEVAAVVTSVLAKAGVPENRQHPHVFRHSIVTHLLERNVPPKAVQDRVGHAVLATTLDYARVTKTAAAALENALGDIYGRDA